MSDWRESIARQLIERAEDDATTPLLMKIELARECFDDYSKLERELAAAKAECEALREETAETRKATGLTWTDCPIDANAKTG